MKKLFELGAHVKKIFELGAREFNLLNFVLYNFLLEISKF